MGKYRSGRSVEHSIPRFSKIPKRGSQGDDARKQPFLAALECHHANLAVL